VPVTYDEGGDPACWADEFADHLGLEPATHQDGAPMDQTPTPLEVVTRFYEALATRDFDAILELTSPDIVVTQDPSLPWGGRYEGHDGLGAISLALFSAIDSAVTIEAIFEAGDRVVQYGRTAGTVRANGVAFDIPECHVWRVDAGRAVEAQYFIDTPAMLRALAGEG